MEERRLVMEEHGGDGAEPTTMLEETALDEAFKGVQELMQVGADSVSAQQKLGVLQRIVTAVLKDEEYRQILLTAAFDNKQEALLAADAISERQRYGVSIQPILDRLIAQCSIKANRVERILTALTHYTLNTNYGGRLPDWKRKQNSRSIT